MKKKVTVWFSKVGTENNAVISGPFNTQAEAAQYTMKPNGFPMDGAFVWPVEG